MRSAASAVAFARRYRTYRSGYCLNFVQTMLGAPWSGPSAIWAWNHARHKHSDLTPPPGVPVYWTGGRYGHVALSVGGGRVRSTDWPSRGRVGEVSISTLSRAWGKRYAGWASDIGGRSIAGVGSSGSSGDSRPQVYVNRLRYGVKDSDSVRHMQRRLIHLGFQIPAGPTGNYYSQTDRAVRAWQRSIGDHVDRQGHSYLGPRQTAALFRGQKVRIHP